MSHSINHPAPGGASKPNAPTKPVAAKGPPNEDKKNQFAGPWSALDPKLQAQLGDYSSQGREVATFKNGQLNVDPRNPSRHATVTLKNGSTYEVWTLPGPDGKKAWTVLPDHVAGIMRELPTIGEPTGLSGRGMNAATFTNGQIIPNDSNPKEFAVIVDSSLYRAKQGTDGKWKLEASLKGPKGPDASDATFYGPWSALPPTLRRELGSVKEGVGDRGRVFQSFENGSVRVDELNPSGRFWLDIGKNQYEALKGIDGKWKLELVAAATRGPDKSDRNYYEPWSMLPPSIQGELGNIKEGVGDRGRVFQSFENGTMRLNESNSGFTVALRDGRQWEATRGSDGNWSTVTGPVR